MEKSFLPHILYTYIQNLFKFRFISTYHPLLSFIEEEEEEGRKGLFPRVSTSCEGMKSGASKEGGERERESSSFWKRRLERERERIRNSLWSASDWRFCIAEADVQPLAESTFSFSSRCEACRVASRATGLVPPLQETRWLVPSLDYPDYCSSKIGGGRGRKEGRRGEGTEVFVMNKDARGSLRFFCKRRLRSFWDWRGLATVWENDGRSTPSCKMIAWS